MDRTAFEGSTPWGNSFKVLTSESSHNIGILSFHHYRHLHIGMDSIPINCLCVFCVGDTPNTIPLFFTAFNSVAKLHSLQRSVPCFKTFSISVVLGFGKSRGSWTAVPRSCHHQLYWLGFLGVSAQEPLDYPRLGTTALFQIQVNKNILRRESKASVLKWPISTTKKHGGFLVTDLSVIVRCAIFLFKGDFLFLTHTYKCGYGNFMQISISFGNTLISSFFAMH